MSAAQPLQGIQPPEILLRLRAAANEDFPPLPVVQRGAPPGKQAPSLAGPFLASLMLHLLAAATLSLHAPYPVVKDMAPRLELTLVRPLAPLPATQLAELAPVPAAPASDFQPPRSVETVIRRGARFLDDPDLTILEQIPVATQGSITLRLQVNAQGVVESVAVARSDPAPQALVEGLKQRFGAARLSPALVDGSPAASSIEVTVRFEPGLYPLDPDRN